MTQNGMSRKAGEASIVEAMADVGYQRLRPDIYKAIWSSSEVEHFVYLSSFGSRKEFLTGHFGIRNPIAEAFSAKSIGTYGGEFMFKALAYDHVATCSMRFSFGRLMPTTPRWFLPILELSNLELASSVQAFAKERLLPVIRNVTTVDRLFSLVVEDREPCPWIASNGAIRAAQVVALAGLGGRDAAQVRAILISRERFISQGFMKESAMRHDPGSYIDRIVADWAVGSDSPAMQI